MSLSLDSILEKPSHDHEGKVLSIGLAILDRECNELNFVVSEKIEEDAKSGTGMCLDRFLVWIVISLLLFFLLLTFTG